MASDSFTLGGGNFYLDSLFDYKRSFGGVVYGYHTLDVIADELRYRNLVERPMNYESLPRVRQDFFPRYRAWLLPVCPPTEGAATRGVAALRGHGVGARLIYRYSPEAACSYGYRGDCPQAERLSRTVFVLPAHSGLTPLDRQHTLECVRLLAKIR